MLTMNINQIKIGQLYTYKNEIILALQYKEYDNISYVKFLSLSDKEEFLLDKFTIESGCYYYNTQHYIKELI